MSFEEYKEDFDIESLKILSMVDTLLIWDYCAEHGCGKIEAIENLYKEGKISLDIYNHGCPFCEYLRILENDFEDDGDNIYSGKCQNCLWPGIKKADVRCEWENSFYKKWFNIKYKFDGDNWFDRENKMKFYANKIVNMLLKTKM